MILVIKIKSYIHYALKQLDSLSLVYWLNIIAARVAATHYISLFWSQGICLKYHITAVQASRKNKQLPRKLSKLLLLYVNFHSFSLQRIYDSDCGV